MARRIFIILAALCSIVGGSEIQFAAAGPLAARADKIVEDDPLVQKIRQVNDSVTT
jgi:hypothetical protein